MTTTEKMDMDERHKYLRIMRQQYRRAQTRRAKQESLDQMETITGLHRKFLIQLMQPAALKHHPRQQVSIHVSLHAIMYQGFRHCVVDVCG